MGVATELAKSKDGGSLGNAEATAASVHQFPRRKAAGR